MTKVRVTHPDLTTAIDLPSESFTDASKRVEKVRYVNDNVHDPINNHVRILRVHLQKRIHLHRFPHCSGIPFRVSKTTPSPSTSRSSSTTKSLVFVLVLTLRSLGGSNRTPKEVRRRLLSIHQKTSISVQIRRKGEINTDPISNVRLFLLHPSPLRGWPSIFSISCRTFVRRMRSAVEGKV